jgi:hypothetical protein
VLLYGKELLEEEEEEDVELLLLDDDIEEEREVGVRSDEMNLPPPLFSRHRATRPAPNWTHGITCNHTTHHTMISHGH